MNLALAEVGTKEILGPGDNPRILDYQRTTNNVSHDEIPWCSSFVNWVLFHNDYEGTNNALAISWKNWGMELSDPIYGCLVVFEHHVGFFVKKAPMFINVLGGNQQNQVGKSWFKTQAVISYRYPTEAQRKPKVLL